MILAALGSLEILFRQTLLPMALYSTEEAARQAHEEQRVYFRMWQGGALRYSVEITLLFISLCFLPAICAFAAHKPHKHLSMRFSQRRWRGVAKLRR